MKQLYKKMEMRTMVITRSFTKREQSFMPKGRKIKRMSNEGKSLKIKRLFTRTFKMLQLRKKYSQKDLEVTIIHEKKWELF